MENEDSIASYVQKWQAFWPEQVILDVFVPKQQLTKCQAWVGLLFELHNCAFAIEHDAVREQKALWWSQELKAINHGSVRHPLSQVFQEFSADYAQLADAFLFISSQTPVRSSNTNVLLKQLQPLAQAIAHVENQLFSNNARFRHVSGNAITVQLLLMRIPHGLQSFDQALVPMHLLARHQALNEQQSPLALLNDWLEELMALLNDSGSDNWLRAAQTSFCRLRIKQLRHNGKSKIQFGHVWHAWRAVHSHQNS